MSSDVADVEQALGAVHREPHGLGWSGGDLEYPGEVVASPARDDRQRRCGVGEHSRQRAQQPVAAHRRHGLSSLDGLAGLFGGMADVAGRDRAVLRPEPRELGLGDGQPLERPAPARGRVHQQQEAAAQAGIISARWTRASPSRRSAWGSSAFERVEREQHVLLHRVPRLIGQVLRGHHQAIVARQPVQLAVPEAVGVEALTVGEHEVQVREGRSRDHRRHRPAQRPGHVGGIEVAHEVVEDRLGVRLARRGLHPRLEQPRVGRDRAVVAERVVAEHEGMGVHERLPAVRGAAHVHVEDPAGHGGRALRCRRRRTRGTGTASARRPQRARRRPCPSPSRRLRPSGSRGSPPPSSSCLIDTGSGATQPNTRHMRAVYAYRKGAKRARSIPVPLTTDDGRTG